MLFSFVHSTPTSQSSDTAEVFYRFFAKVGITVQKTSDFSTPITLNQINSSVFVEKVSILYVDDITSSLSNKLSSGVDNVNEILVKMSKHVTLPLLTTLINQLLKQGVFPQVLKIQSFTTS